MNIPPSFRKVFKRFIGDSYDYLGLVLLCSFVWLGVSLGLLTLLLRFAGVKHPALFFAGLTLLYIVIVSPLTAAAHFLARKVVTRDDPSPLDLLVGLRTNLSASWALGAWQVIITGVLLANVWFYLTHGGMPLRILSVLFIYVTIAWVLSCIYHYPMLIEQNPGALKIVKRGFLLMMDNLAFTAGVFSVIILLAGLCLATLLGLPLLFQGMLSILQTRALRAVFVKYGLLEPEKEYMPDEEDEHFSIEA